MKQLITMTMAIFLVSTSAFAKLNDIECSMGKSSGDSLTTKKLPDSTNVDREKIDWKTFKIEENKFEVACVVEEELFLYCSLVKIEKNNTNKHIASIKGLVGISFFTKEIKGVCNSETLRGMLYHSIQGEVLETPEQERVLTSEELSFCHYLGDQGSMFLRDQRLACVPHLKRLPRALTAAELDHCRYDYSLDYMSMYDNRLNCVDTLVR